MEALQEKGKIAQSLYTQPLMAMQLVRLAEFVDESEWIRPIDDWEPEVRKLHVVKQLYIHI